MNKKLNRAIELMLFPIALLFLSPLFYLLITSFKSPAQFNNPFVIPLKPYWGHYELVFEKIRVLSGFMNTIIIVTASLGLLIFVASLAGYAIARVKGKLFQLMFYFFLSGMIIPLQTKVIPLFELGVNLNLIDTRTFLVLLYAANSIPFAVFVYVGFMRTIPREIEESASIDGSNTIQTFLRIVFPLLLPATGTIFITQIFSIYNDLFSPLLFLKNPDRMTLMPQIVQFMANEQNSNYGPVFALSVLAMIPIVLFFLVTQKYMIRGLVTGAVKG